jgi:REP element-mobilizing transposase RayT
VLPLAIGGVEDHVHLLFALRPNQRIADIVRDIKAHSSHWIRETLGVSSFGWQDGYGVFTVSPEHDQVLRKYIEDQEAHHRQRPYQAEYVALLKQHAIGHDSNRLW